jgi:transcriptional regulator with XRE-family HTH domain
VLDEHHRVEYSLGMARMTVEKEVGEQLRMLRERQGLSCRQVAALNGWNHSSVSRLERGAPTTLTRYAKHARALGARLYVLVRGD